MNASIYISNPSILGSNLFDQMKEIKSYKDLSDEGTATGFVLTLDFGEITFNFMPYNQIKNHLEGFASYAQQAIENKDAQTRILSRIRDIQLVLGGIFTIQPGAEDKMKEFIFKFKDKLNGLLFMDNGIYE